MKTSSRPVQPPDDLRRRHRPGPAFRAARAVVLLLLAPVSGPVLIWRYRRKAEERRAREAAQRIRALGTYLWSAERDAAIAELERIRKDHPAGSAEHGDASEVLAAFLASQGDPARALAVHETVALDALPEPQRGSNRRLRAVLLWQAGRAAEARAALGPPETLHDARDRLVAVTVAPDAEARLAMLDAFYTERGLAGVGKADPKTPAGFFNIAWGACPPATPDMGKVSVIFPVYNAADTIDRSVASILEQSYRDVEVILCDDCSTDGTDRVIADIAARDDRVRVLRQDRNGGAYAARNRGLAAATGDFVMIHDADDISHPQKLERHMQAFAADERLVACGSYWARTTPDLAFTSWNGHAEPIRYSYPSYTIRRAVFDAIGDWDTVQVSGDAEFIHRTEQHYGKDRTAWIHPDIPLALSLAHPGSLTGCSATHVGSVRHGLRRYYHEAYKYLWREGRALGPDARRRRFALVPRDILERRPDPVSVDRLFVTDFRRADAVSRLAALIEATPGRIAIAYRPEIAAAGLDADRFQDGIFRLIETHGLIVAADETSVQAGDVLAVRAGDDRTGTGLGEP